MKRTTAFFAGAGFGAALMYVLDPRQGRARRARIEGQLTRAAHDTEREIARSASDVRNRTRGFFSELLARLRPEEISDDTLVARVRAKMGHVIPTPHAVEVRAEGGWVTLAGDLPGDDAERLLHAVARVRGVRGVENQLRPGEAGAIEDAPPAPAPSPTR